MVRSRAVLTLLLEEMASFPHLMERETSAFVVPSLHVTRQALNLEPRAVLNCRHLSSASFGPGLASRGQNRKEEQEVDHFLDVSPFLARQISLLEVLEHCKVNLISLK